MAPTIGLYLDLRNPGRWARPWDQWYGWWLDLIDEADRRGIGAIWATEHHFFEDGYLPQPLTFLAAAAARTSQCRLGAAVVVAPLRPAVQIAEEAAVVDLLSAGRLELGLGAGYVRPEFEAYGADITNRYVETDARLVEVGRLLAEGWLTPPAAQRPVPIWAGYLGPTGAARAGRLGVGLLTLDRDSHAIYRDALAENGHPVDSARTGGVLPLLVADDPEAAYERVLPHLTHQLNSYRVNAAAGTGRTARLLSEEEVRGRGSGVIKPLEVVTAPEAVRRITAATEGLPVEHVYLWASIAGMPDDLVQRQMELLTDEVIPDLDE